MAADRPPLLHVRFRDQARGTPDRISLRSGARSVTYGELADGVDRVEAALRASGCAPGDLVGLHMRRSVDWVVAMLGALQADLTVLPLPPDYPSARIREIVDLARPTLILSEDDGSGVAPAARWTSLQRLLETARGDVGRGPASVDDQDPDRAAFVLSSSGSTGRPKLIVRSHRSFFHRLRWTWERQPYREGEVCCQKAHMTTTHSIYELFEPLLAGVPVVLMSDDDVRDLDVFWSTLRAHRVSRLLVVPSYLRASLESPAFEPPPIEVVTLMGEHVDAKLARRSVEAFPSTTRIYSIYGSTEASSTLVSDLRDLPHARQEPTLGTPISADIEPLVLTSDGRTAEVGETGRLHVAGPALFSGYLGRPDLTTAVLARSPDDDRLLYDTQDDVEVTAHGLRYLGRADHTVKVRGYRVSIVEVEGSLMRHPQVAAAAVVVQDRGAEGAAMVGFVSPADVDVDGVKAELEATLPAYMVPSRLIARESLPSTDSGKVDRARLLQLATRGRPSFGERTDESETELRVRREWTRVLGHEDFDRNRTFFEAGGTSLTVFSLVHGLRAALGLDGDEMTARLVYRFPTVAGLAEWLERSRDEDPVEQDEPLLVPLKRGSDRAASPVFMIASAGGTVGAYEKLVEELDTERDVFGVRDPFLWGARLAEEDFQTWVDRYVAAIRTRQAEGPYFVVAYSSAGAFGFEITRRLRSNGEATGLLMLIDPLALDRADRGRYGHWALRATYGRAVFRLAVRLAGWLRIPLAAIVRSVSREEQPENRHALSTGEAREIARGSTGGRAHVMSIAALMELNTGLPLTLEDADLDGSEADGPLRVLQRRLSEHLPGVDDETIERIVVQYEMQVRAQHAYRLSRLEGPVLLVEPRTRYAGLLAAQLRPYAPELTALRIPLSEPTDRVRAICARFGPLESHYRSMRDPTFVRGAARALAERI